MQSIKVQSSYNNMNRSVSVKDLSNRLYDTTKSKEHMKKLKDDKDFYDLKIDRKT